MADLIKYTSPELQLFSRKSLVQQNNEFTQHTGKYDGDTVITFLRFAKWKHVDTPLIRNPEQVWKEYIVDGRVGVHTNSPFVTESQRLRRTIQELQTKDLSPYELLAKIKEQEPDVLVYLQEIVLNNRTRVLSLNPDELRDEIIGNVSHVVKNNCLGISAHGAVDVADDLMQHLRKIIA